jgi:hypothetical protein
MSPQVSASNGPIPMRRILFTAVIIATTSSFANAQELPHVKTQSGEEMVEACRIIADGIVPPANKTFQAGICLGEIEALNWVAPGLAGDPIRACVPADVTQQQLAKVVADYLEQNADRLREPFQGLALEALAGTWPCPARKSGWLVGLWNRIFPME